MEAVGAHMSDNSVFPRKGEAIGELYVVGSLGLFKRELFAAMALQGLLSNSGIIEAVGSGESTPEQVVRVAISYARVLIAELATECT